MLRKKKEEKAQKQELSFPGSCIFSPLVTVKLLTERFGMHFALRGVPFKRYSMKNKPSAITLVSELIMQYDYDFS